MDPRCDPATPIPKRASRTAWDHDDDGGDDDEYDDDNDDDDDDDIDDDDNDNDDDDDWVRVLRVRCSIK